MKKNILLLAALLTAGNAFGGQEMTSSSKESKATVVTECFTAQEFQFDLYGQYTDGNHPNAGNIDEHGWGGGVGVNYFITQRLGIGADATWLNAREADYSGTGDSDRTDIFNFSASLIYRFPMECIAPYIYAGGGVSIDGEQWANAHGGVGIEYRIVPNRVGLFTDARFTYFGDRFGHGDHNNISARAGVRWIF